MRLLSVNFPVLGRMAPRRRLIFRFMAPVLCVWAAVCAASPDDTAFVVPDALKNNVAFWKIIYTAIPLSRGLVHDRDYPLIIYDTVDVDLDWRSYRRTRTDVLEKAKTTLTALRTKPESEWSDRERRIKALFDTYAPGESLDKAEERISLQRGNSERYLGGLRRSGMYIDTIRAVLARYNIPQRIAYLPHVESSFDYTAYSSVGAAGVWQFMRYTGRYYLTINYLVDERLDPVASTVAAAKLLTQYYNELGSWPLTITAYNYGVNAMKRASRIAGSRDIAEIIRKSTMPYESKSFYACFLAASEIAMNASAVVGPISYLPKLQYREMTLKYFIQPRVLCSYLGISEDDLREVNPALRPVIFQRQKAIPAGYALRLPLSASIDEAHKIIAERIPDSLKSDKPEQVQYYRVRRGENLSTIADRLSVGAAQLALDNGITRASGIYAGQVLRVPAKPKGKTAPAPAATVPLAAREIPPAIGDTHERPLFPAAGMPDSAPAAPVQITAPVPPIATKYAATDSLREILSAVADTLPETPRGPRPAGRIGFDVEMYDLETVMSPDANAAEITVSVDETISHYADWLGVPAGEIRSLNGLGRSSTIRVGRRLAIPMARPDALIQFAKTRLEYHLALEEDFYGRFKIADVKPRTIARGERLWDICRADVEIPLWLFKKYNRHLDLAKLMPGVTVWLPVIAPKTAEDIARESMEDGGIRPAWRLSIGSGAQRVTLVP